MENMFKVAGKIKSIEKSHSYTTRDGETNDFYKAVIEVPRLSDKSDELPMVIPGKVMAKSMPEKDDLVLMEGQVRSRNYTEGESGHLAVFGYVASIAALDGLSYDDIDNKNIVKLDGYVCKEPTFRKTRTGRTISDLLIAHNRKPYDGVHYKSDYVPAVAWGALAGKASKMPVGECVEICGRFQSRSYLRKSDSKERTVHEISVTSLDIVPGGRLTAGTESHHEELHDENSKVA